MSKNNTINGTPGILRVVPKQPKPDFGLATKITGRNFAAVSYIISLEAERRGVEIEATAKFATDGRLVSITVSETGGDPDDLVDPFTEVRPNVVLVPGEYLILGPNQAEAQITDEDTFKRFFEVA